MTFFTASSFYSIFTQVSKTFNSTVALQEVSRSILETLLVLLDLVGLSFFCFFMSFQTDWWWTDLSVESHKITTIKGKMNV